MRRFAAGLNAKVKKKAEARGWVFGLMDVV
jgi:hypothetical protein